MRILKNSTNIPNEVIRAMAAAVAPPGVTNYRITVDNSTRNGWSGRAWTHSNRIHVRIGTRAIRCFTWGRKSKGYLTGIAIGSRAEALLFVIAHELRHLWQQQHPRGWRVWGSRGRFSERDADAYALRCLRMYRRGELGKFDVPADDPARNKPKTKRPRGTLEGRVIYAATQAGAIMKGSLITSPDGKQFAATNTHVLDFDGTRESAELVIEDLSHGFEDCPEDCDCRHESEAA